MAKAKLGMTVQPPPKRKSPYAKIGARMQEGAKEQGKLERRGVQILNRLEVDEAIKKSQKKIPKAAPQPPEPGDVDEEG